MTGLGNFHDSTSKRVLETLITVLHFLSPSSLLALEEWKSVGNLLGQFGSFIFPHSSYICVLPKLRKDAER